MTTITMPRTLRGAERKLNELGELATATEWERAAIVATFVKVRRLGENQHTEASDIESLESAAAFARRGIHGLTSASTVIIYAQCWLDRFPRPEPGRRVELPTEPWPPTRTGTDGYNSEDGAQRTIDRIIRQHGAATVTAAIETHPEIVEPITARAMADPEIVEPLLADPEIDNSVRTAQVRRAIGRPRPRPAGDRPPPLGAGHGGPIRSARTLAIGEIEMRMASSSQGWALLLMEAAEVPGYMDEVTDDMSNRDSHLQFVFDYMLSNLLLGAVKCGLTEADLLDRCKTVIANLPSTVDVTDEDLERLLNGG